MKTTENHGGHERTEKQHRDTRTEVDIGMRTPNPTEEETKRISLGAKARVDITKTKAEEEDSRGMKIVAEDSVAETRTSGSEESGAPEGLMTAVADSTEKKVEEEELTRLTKKGRRTGNETMTLVDGGTKIETMEEVGKIKRIGEDGKRVKAITAEAIKKEVVVEEAGMMEVVTAETSEFSKLNYQIRLLLTIVLLRDNCG